MICTDTPALVDTGDQLFPCVGEWRLRLRVDRAGPRSIAWLIWESPGHPPGRRVGLSAHEAQAVVRVIDSTFPLQAWRQLHDSLIVDDGHSVLTVEGQLFQAAHCLRVALSSPAVSTADAYLSIPSARALGAVLRDDFPSMVAVGEARQRKPPTPRPEAYASVAASP